jgi:hypothetical protein
MKASCRPLCSVIVFAVIAALGCGPALASAGTDAPAITKDTYKIIIDKKTQIFTVLSQDEEGAYTVVVRQMPCSTGRVDKDTPVGTFKIGTKARWLSSQKYGTFEQYASRIVGSIWIHSTIFKKKDPNTLVKSSFKNIGRPASMGCIRLSVGDAKWVFDNCPKGTAVQIVKSGGPETLCVETLPPQPNPGDFDPTDPAVQKPQPAAQADVEQEQPAAVNDLMPLLNSQPLQ